MLFERIACKEALYSKYDFKKSLFFFYEPCLILCWVYLTSNAIETPETTLKQPKIYQRYSYFAFSAMFINMKARELFSHKNILR